MLQVQFQLANKSANGNFAYFRFTLFKMTILYRDGWTNRSADLKTNMKGVGNG